MKSFHTEAKHPFTSLLGGRESCCGAGWGGDTSAPQLFWVNWSLPTDLLSCQKRLRPSFLELLQLFLEEDSVERGCYGPGTAGIFKDLSAAHSKFQHPEVMMSVVEDSEEELILQSAESFSEIWWHSYWETSRLEMDMGKAEERRDSSLWMTWGKTHEILWETSNMGSGGEILGPRNYRLIISWSEQSIVTSIVICLQIAHVVSLRRSWPQALDCRFWRLWTIITLCPITCHSISPRTLGLWIPKRGTKDWVS